MRIFDSILVSTLISIAVGCGDDTPADASDAGADAATDGRVPPVDAGDPKDAGDAGDPGDTACDLEPSYVWAECDEQSPDRVARRLTLEAFCMEYTCPPDWTAALELVADCDEADAGFDTCWEVSTGCGADVISNFFDSPDEFFLHYDRATGKLVGAAIQLTDISRPCVVSEIIAGVNRPRCACDDIADAGD